MANLSNSCPEGCVWDPITQICVAKDSLGTVQRTAKYTGKYPKLFYKGQEFRRKANQLAKDFDIGKRIKPLSRDEEKSLLRNLRKQKKEYKKQFKELEKVDKIGSRYLKKIDPKYLDYTVGGLEDYGQYIDPYTRGYLMSKPDYKPEEEKTLNPYSILNTRQGYSAIRDARNKGKISQREWRNYLENYGGRKFDPLRYDLTPEQQKRWEQEWGRPGEMTDFTNKIGSLMNTTMQGLALGSAFMGATPTTRSISALARNPNTPSLRNILNRNIANSDLTRATITGAKNLWNKPILRSPATVGDAVNLGFGAYYGSKIPEAIKEGNYGEAGIGAINVLASPGVGNMLKTSYNTIKNVPKILSNQYNKTFKNASSNVKLIENLKNSGLISKTIPTKTLVENPKLLDLATRQGIKKQTTVTRNVFPRNIKSLSDIEAAFLTGTTQRSNWTGKNKGGLGDMPRDLQALYTFKGGINPEKPIDPQFGTFAVESRIPFNYQGDAATLFKRYKNMPFLKAKKMDNIPYNNRYKPGNIIEGVYGEPNYRAIIGEFGEQSLAPVKLITDPKATDMYKSAMDIRETLSLLETAKDKKFVEDLYKRKFKDFDSAKEWLNSKLRNYTNEFVKFNMGEKKMGPFKTHHYSPLNFKFNKPTNYSSAPNANLNTGTESVIGKIRDSIFNNKYFSYLPHLGKEIAGELIQGQANRRAIKKGNEWLKKWIEHPVTQQKIIESEPYIARAKDGEFLREFNFGKDQARTFNPSTKEYGFRNQLKDLINTKEHIHKDNLGVSYLHKIDPAETYLTKIGELDSFPRFGSFISRSPLIKQRNRESITIHEGTHDWLTNFMLDNTKQKRLIESLMSGNAYDKYRKWTNLRNQGIDPANKMGKTEAYLGHLANPTEVHARIMELRRALGLTPKDFISEKKAESIIKNLNEGKINAKVDPSFLKTFNDNPRSIATLFNKLWYADPKNADPVLQQQMNDPLFKAKGGYLNKPKNIPMYYDFKGTPIYRDTTSLPFRYGGRMKNNYQDGGLLSRLFRKKNQGIPTSNINIFNSSIPYLDKINYVPSTTSFTPGFEEGPELEAYDKAYDEMLAAKGKTKTTKKELEAEKERIKKGKETALKLADIATYGDQYSNVFKTKLSPITKEDPLGGTYQKKPTYCMTRNCELEKQAGYTTVRDMYLYNKFVPEGSPLKVIPGISSWVSHAKEMGYKKVDPENREPGDVALFTSPGKRSPSKAYHAVKYAGPPSEKALYYNKNKASKYPEAGSFYSDPGSGEEYIFYNKYFAPKDVTHYYRYVGKTPQLQSAYDKAIANYKLEKEELGQTTVPRMKPMTVDRLTPTVNQMGRTYNLDTESPQLMEDQRKYVQNLGNMLNRQRMFRSGGYTVTRSDDRKGKTHKVTRKSDGKTEYYGHPMKNQPKNAKTKNAAEARHRAQGNFQNPFFKAYWDATWRYGGNMYGHGGHMYDLFTHGTYANGGNLNNPCPPGYVFYKGECVPEMLPVLDTTITNPISKPFPKKTNFPKRFNPSTKLNNIKKFPLNIPKGTSNSFPRPTESLPKGIKYFKKGGNLIKRADGSYSQRGLWDNIRAKAERNKATGKKGQKPKPGSPMDKQIKRIERNN